MPVDLRPLRVSEQQLPRFARSSSELAEVMIDVQVSPPLPLDQLSGIVSV
jgi:hypothetical protein